MKNITNIFSIVLLFGFGSTCFGAKELTLDNIKYYLCVCDSGTVKFMKSDDPRSTSRDVEFTNEGYKDKEIFKLSETENSKSFLVFPIGVYEFLLLNEKVIDVKQFYAFNKTNCCKIGEYFFFILENDIYFAKNGDEYVLKYYHEQDFKIETLEIINEGSSQALVVFDLSGNKHKVIELTEIERCYDDLCSLTKPDYWR